MRALSRRMDAFGALVCRAAAHGLYRPVCRQATEAELDGIFRRAASGEEISDAEADAYRTALLCFCAGE